MKRAVFCYYIFRFNRAMHAWLIMITDSVKDFNWLSTDDNELDKTASWFTPLLDKKLDFDSVLRLLSGDAFY